MIETIQLYFINQIQTWGINGVVTNIVDYDTGESEFKFLSRYYPNFLIYILAKGLTPNSPVIGWIVSLLLFY